MTVFSRVLVVATVIHALGNLVWQSVPLMGPRLIEDLDLSAAQFGTLVGAVGAGNVLLLWIAGHVADRLDARRVLAGAAAAAGAVTMALGVSSGYVMMLLLLTAVGMAVAATISAGGGAVYSAAPPRSRGLAVSIRQTGLPVGGILAAVLVPVLLDVADWRMVFLLEGLLFVFAAGWVVRTPFPAVLPAVAARRPPITGAEWRTLGLLGVVGLAFGGAQWGYLGFLPLQMTDRFGRSFELAAAVFLATQVAGLLSRLAVGWLSDRRGERAGVLVLLSVVGAASLGVLSVLPADASLLWLLGSVGIAGFCLLGWNGVLITAFAEASAPERVSLSIGFGLTFVGAGMMAAPVLIGVTGIARSPQLFAVLAALLLLACLLVLAHTRGVAAASPSGEARST